MDVMKKVDGNMDKLVEEEGHARNKLGSVEVRAMMDNVQLHEADRLWAVLMRSSCRLRM